MDREEAIEIAEDAYGHFIHGWDIDDNDLILNNLYNRSWTQDKSIDEDVYILASETLLDFENAPKDEAIEALADKLEKINLHPEDDDYDVYDEMDEIYASVEEGLKYIIKDIIEESKLVEEGQFSWFTQDTDNQIGSMQENTLPEVYMTDNEGNEWIEKNYEGYGEFGGKDYYELVAEMNGISQDDIGGGDLRDEGIGIYFGQGYDPMTGEDFLFPALTEKPINVDSWDFTQKPEDDPNQSWAMEEDDDDEYDEDDSEW